MLCAVLSSSQGRLSWQDEVKPVDFFAAKGVVETILSRLELVASFEAAEDESLYPGRSADITVGNDKVGVVGDVGRAGEDHVIEQDHLDADEVQGGHLDHSDEEEPVDDGDQSLGEQNEVCAGDCGDGAAGPERGGHRVVVEQHVSEAAEDGAGEIESDVSEMSELVVDVVSEHIQKKHIADDVHKSAVQKSVTYKLPDTKFTGSKHEVRNPASERQTTLWGYT